MTRFTPLRLRAQRRHFRFATPTRTYYHQMVDGVPWRLQVVLASVTRRYAQIAAAQALAPSLIERARDDKI